MGKEARITSRRTAKLRRRAARAGKRDAHQFPFLHDGGLAHLGPVPAGFDLDGWHIMGGPGDDIEELDDRPFAEPDEALLDTSRCPIAESCAGCGGTEHLHSVTSAFSKPGGFDVACATLCHACDNGRSFLHRLGPAGLDEAFARHAAHHEAG
ncbi:hypothetical protein ACIQUM_36905 [Amycolatopsis azurea]|uniref:hypothetical protein n=1 Tax=Amycolatopsis azurea TaxID=36819 RepID=UPI0037FF4025